MKLYEDDNFVCFVGDLAKSQFPSLLSLGLSKNTLIRCPKDSEWGNFGENGIDEFKEYVDRV